MANLSVAISIASQAFENKFDKGGNPYILHCLVVMNKVKHLGETAMICAVLHDLIEDCANWSYDELLKRGFSQEVVVILQLLTHRKDTDYMDYVRGLAIHPLAKQIKKADLEHNMQLDRLKGVTKKDFDRIHKYCVAYEYLKD